MIDYAAAKDVFSERLVKGRKIGLGSDRVIFPYGNRYKHDQFITANVCLSDIQYNASDKDLVSYYAGTLKRHSMDEVWLSYGKRMADGTINRHWHGKFQLKDGNHRTEAHSLLGHQTIKAFIPCKDYSYYMKRFT